MTATMWWTLIGIIAACAGSYISGVIHERKRRHQDIFRKLPKS